MRPKNPWNSDTHERMRRLWDERIAPTGMSQEEFGERYGIGTQGMVSQYLLGTRPLNYDAALKFADGFRCTIADICPDMAERLARDFFPKLGMKLPRGGLRRRIAGVAIAGAALALILHNQFSDTAQFCAASLGHITHWILRQLRKFAPLGFLALAACSTPQYVQVAYIETPQSELHTVCPRLIGTSGGCVVHKAGVAYIYAPAPRDVQDQFALYVLGHEFYCHAWLKQSHIDDEGVRRDPDKDCKKAAAL